MADRHAVDSASLVTGLLAVTGSALYLLDDAGAVAVDEAVAAAVLLVVLGAVSLLRSLRLLRRPGG